MFLALFRKLLHATMSDMSTKRKSNDDSHNGKNNFSNIVKKKRTTINVSSSMLTFLREPRIESFMSEFKIKPFDDVSGVMRKSHNSFQTKKRHASWKPFLQLKELLTSDKAIEPLTRSHHRLFFEDCMQLDKSEEVVFMFSSDAPMLQDKSIVRSLSQNIKINPLKPIAFENTFFHSNLSSGPIDSVMTLKIII